LPGRVMNEVIFTWPSQATDFGKLAALVAMMVVCVGALAGLSALSGRSRVKTTSSRS
jgi:hypothetical protein